MRGGLLKAGRQEREIGEGCNAAGGWWWRVVDLLFIFIAPVRKDKFLFMATGREWVDG